MLAAVLQKGSPTLEILEIPVPTPKAEEVLLKVLACGVCHTDLHVIKGEVNFPRPAVLGHEVSGRVVAIGEGTSEQFSIHIGDSVVSGFIMPCTMCAQCRQGRDDLCSTFFAENRLKGVLYDGTSRLQMPDGSFLAMYSMGGFAEYCVVPLSALTKVPDSLDIQTASILGCAGLTAYGALTRAGQVDSSDSIAIVGVGGVGSTIIQFAKALGVTTIIAIDIDDDKLFRAKEMGATHSLNSLALDPVAEIENIIRGGVTVVFEALGSAVTFKQSSQMLAEGGRMIAIGIAPIGVMGEVEITRLVRRGQSIVGSFGGRTRVDLPKVIELASSGSFDLETLVSRRYQLEEIGEAFAALDQKEISGRAIIVFH